VELPSKFGLDAASILENLVPMECLYVGLAELLDGGRQLSGQSVATSLSAFYLT